MKKTLDGINLLYPTPTTIVGAMVESKPNFITIAQIGIVNHAKPFLISLSMGKPHYTNRKYISVSEDSRPNWHPTSLRVPLFCRTPIFFMSILS